VVQINKDYYEDLVPKSLERILKELKAGRPVMPGPQDGRQASAPLGGPITLTDPELYREEPGAPADPPKPSALKQAPRTSRRPKPR
jgi:NADH-quinone oxidoreductase subunit E